MRSRTYAAIVLALGFTITGASAQTSDSHLADLREALQSNGDTATRHCRNTLLQMVGPFQNFALPDGVSSDGERTWSIVSADVIRFWLNFTELDEDKIESFKVFSLPSIRNHKGKALHEGDTPAVMLVVKGLNSKIVVNTVDLERLRVANGDHLTESQMGVSIDERKYALFVFGDQEHADAFKQAALKTIISCKAEVAARVDASARP